MVKTEGGELLLDAEPGLPFFPFFFMGLLVVVSFGPFSSPFFLPN